MHEALIVFIVIGLPVIWAVLAGVTLGVRLKRSRSADSSRSAGDFQHISHAETYGR